MDVVCLTKKKYIGKITIADDEVLEKPKTLIRGIALVRGDTLPFVKVVYSKLVEMLFSNVPKPAIVAYCNDQIALLRSGQVPRDLLSVMNKTLNSSYESETTPMNVFKRHLQDSGESPRRRGQSYLSSWQSAKAPSEHVIVTVDTTGIPWNYEYYAGLAERPLKQFVIHSKMNHHHYSGINNRTKEAYDMGIMCLYTGSLALTFSWATRLEAKEGKDITLGLVITCSLTFISGMFFQKAMNT